MDKINVFFAIAPFVIFAAIIGTVYVATQRETPKGVPAGQTFICGRCGRRGNREHMLPVREEAQITWYCPRCAATMAKM
ncbi:MAG: hypothetical protein M3Z14_03910 [Candidatus Eremiobacteraeota bacterium]|nr:hypothetical protein [Candidatus Eremiobacteraeota bacterium]